MTRPQLLWLPVALCGALLLAAMPTTSAYIASGGDSMLLWWRIFRPMASYYLGWALITPLIWWLTFRLPARAPSRPLRLASHLALLVGYSTVATLVHGPQWQEWLWGRHAVGYHLMSVFSYAFATVGCIVFEQIRRAREHERAAQHESLRAARLGEQLSEARIEALRMRINPHFLFNALNTVGALIETRDSERAYRGNELLGQLLREALDASRSDEVRLHEELAFIDRYVELERMRFGDRMRYSVDIDADVREACLPPLILQPLVENAVKHAVSQAPAEGAEPVAITVQARADDTGRIRIRVHDSGGESAPVAGPGIGLETVRERLQGSFGEAASLQAGRADDGGYEVVLSLPRVVAKANPLPD